MGEDIFFIITSTEDGLKVERLTRTDLENRLKESYYGDSKTFATDRAFTKNAYGIDIENFSDCIGSDGMIIIKGSLVQPKAIEVVTRYEI
jgi:hypothetical protein